jgi:hypothetical protein
MLFASSSQLRWLSSLGRVSSVLASAGQLLPSRQEFLQQQVSATTASAAETSSAAGLTTAALFWVSCSSSSTNFRWGFHTTERLVESFSSSLEDNMS